MCVCVCMCAIRSCSHFSGTEPGVFNAARVTSGANGAELTVKDNGADWRDPKVDSLTQSPQTCTCDRARFSTAVMASQKTFGEGFYEAKIKVTSATDYHAGTRHLVY